MRKHSRIISNTRDVYGSFPFQLTSQVPAKHRHGNLYFRNQSNAFLLTSFSIFTLQVIRIIAIKKLVLR